MSTKENVKNQLAQRAAGGVQKQVSPEQSLNSLLKRMGPEIQRALPKHLDADRIARIAMTAVRTTPKLLECDQMSFIAAIMQSAQLGVEPNTGLGQAYLIPYGKQVQFQLGYKGLIDLAVRSGQYKAIYAHEVYESDEFEFHYGLTKDLIHKPASVPTGEPVGYYAVYHLQNGWTSPWKTNFDAMAKKTVLKEVLKYAPKSIEFQKSVEADSTIKNEISKDMSDIIDVTNYTVIDDEPVVEQAVEAETKGKKKSVEEVTNSLV